MDDILSEKHMRLLEWLEDHPGSSPAEAAEALDLDVDEVEALFADLVDEGMIERMWEQ